MQTTMDCSPISSIIVQELRAKRYHLFRMYQWLHCLQTRVLHRKHLFSTCSHHRFPAFQQKRRYRHQRFPLSQSVTYTREINLKYNQNSFAFRFAALCYAAPEENYLSYTLKGFDKEWYSTTKVPPLPIPI